MSDSSVLFECPGCGRRIESGEDYVVALEFEAAVDFSLHAMRQDAAPTAERRFHVEHFRGRLGDRVFMLVAESDS